jgi:hypothetical protein
LYLRAGFWKTTLSALSARSGLWPEPPFAAVAVRIAAIRRERKIRRSPNSQYQNEAAIHQSMDRLGFDAVRLGDMI